MCGKKSGRNKGDKWWYNEEVKDAKSRKKDAHKAMCMNSTDDNRNKQKNTNNKEKQCQSNIREGQTGAY